MIKDFNGTVVCASKYFTDLEMRKLYQQSVFHFGENRVQDFLVKKVKLDDLNIMWHFIGHLQTNKVKEMINEIAYLHTLDRLNLAETIQKLANHQIMCFVQVNLTAESLKSGVLP